jgi:hypothetical protein
MAGVFAVAEQLSLQGWTVSPTSRTAKGVDLLMTKEIGLPLHGQVKTNGVKTSDSFWLVGEKDLTPRNALFYFFVKFHEHAPKDIYVVPSKVVKKHTYSSKTPKGTWYAIDKKDIVRFRDRYDQLES